MHRPFRPDTRAMTLPTPQSPVTYQAHIDGLRAIAVLAVIANHFSKSLLPGGYLGVDIFFVISGFVITASLVSRPHGALGPFLLGFFQRRIKRLLPALLVCVLVTAVLISALDPQPRTSLLTGINALFGFSNIYLYHQAIDYFAPAAQSNAFTQTWSLGVEEQFYLVYPSLFWLAASGRLGRPQRALPLMVGGLSLLSYVFFVHVFASRPAAAYFFTPLRFWELGAGCLLYAGRDSALATLLRHGLSRLGPLPLIALIACLWAPVQHLVPASTAAVVLTCLLLLGPTGLSQRVLTLAPLRHIGLISYSLYLWHWTVLVLARWSTGIDAWHAPWLIAAMFLLAEMSYRWVESPLRHWSGRWAVARGLGASLVVTAVLALLMTQHHRLLLPLDPSLRDAPASLPVKGKAHNPHCVVDGEQRRLEAGTFDLCTQSPRLPGGQTIWAMGDSHAGHLQGMLYRLHRTTGVGVHLIETPGRPYPYVGPVFEPRERIIEAMYARARPGDVLLVSRLYFDLANAQAPTDHTHWATDLRALAGQLAARRMHLVVVGPPPMFDFEHPVVCKRTVFSNAACAQDRKAQALRMEQVSQSLERTLAPEPNAHVFRSFDILCPATGSTCTPVHGGTMIYRDRDHLNTAGAALLAEPMKRFLTARGVLGP